MLNQSEADWVHVDVMDGQFVPNLSFGMLLVDAFKKLSTKPLDVHMMVLNPDQYVPQIRKAGADVITVHYEACTHLHRTLQLIRETGAKAGVALNPHTPVQLIFDILEDIDLVCIMSVNPGFGGQKFIYSTLRKIEQLRQEIDARNLDTLIEVDGGVGLHNAETIMAAGAHVLVAGNAVFATPSPSETIKKFKQIKLEKQL
jgi:ribulose-phosphate 3-epimerase